MATPSVDNPLRLTDKALTRRGTLAAGVGIAAGALICRPSALAQDSDDAAVLNWVDVWGNLHLAAAEGGMEVRGAIEFYQELGPMVQQELLIEEVASAFPSFLGALKALYVLPDPDNASGADFSTTVSVHIYKVESTDDAKTLRDILLAAYAARSDARKLTRDDTGVQGLTAYMIESTFNASGGPIPANFFNGVLIFNNLVVYINAVAYDTDVIGIAAAIAAEARRQLRGVDSAGATFGGLIMAEGIPQATFNIVAFDGNMIAFREETEETRESRRLVADADKIERTYRSDFLVQSETGPPTLYTHSVWIWNDPEDAQRYVERFEEIFAEIDPAQNVTRVFEDVASASVGVRALFPPSAVNLTTTPLSGTHTHRSAFIWEGREGEHWGGCEDVYLEGSRLQSLGGVSLDNRGSNDIEDWLGSPEHEDLRATLDQIREGAETPDERDSIVDSVIANLFFPPRDS
jgi:hypothetical protein